jgi:quercetin dioxygenase-like cupin family protein
MTERLALSPTTEVTVRSESPEALEVEALYGRNGSPPPKHFHPAQAEHFEVLSGSVRTRVAGRERMLQPGDTLDIPARAVHQMWNEADEPARVSWRTTPAGRTLDWFRAIDALHRGEQVRNDLLAEYSDVFQLAGE